MTRDTRELLPFRRPGVTFTLKRGAIEYTVSFGVFDDGRPAEVFVTSRKIGSDVEAVCRDAAILLSLCLQHGCPFDIIRHALTRNQDNTPQSLIGEVVDRIETEVRL
ncbi:MAG: hypothetical protein J2P55_00125 [Rhizobiales bacterium]|nr:hypothetical protein [Hyphomicrobiales bacterium]